MHHLGIGVFLGGYGLCRLNDLGLIKGTEGQGKKPVM